MDNRPLSRIRCLTGTLQGRIVLLALLVGALYLMLAHQPHVLAALPFAILLLCPLMHVFMHGGHGGHGGHGSNE